MDGAVDEVATDNNGELKVKDVNVRLRTIPDRSENSLHKNVDETEGKGFSRCLPSCPGSGPPCTSPYSVNDTRTKDTVEELTVGSYRISTNISRGDKFNNLGHLITASKFMDLDREGSLPQGMDQMLSKIRQQLAGTPPDRQSLDYLKSKRSDQSLGAVSAYLRATGNMNLSNAALTDMTSQQKPLPTSGFSQLILQRTLRGKGIVSGNTEIHSENYGENSDGGEDKMGNKCRAASGALLKSNTNCNKVTLHGVDINAPNSYNNGINLRQLMKPGFSKRNKARRLSLFRQIVELVDQAHSQGYVLLDMRPAFLTLLPASKVIYTGSFDKKESDCALNEYLHRKRLPEQEVPTELRVSKLQRLDGGMLSLGNVPFLASSCKIRNRTGSKTEFHAVVSQASGSPEHQCEEYISYPKMTLSREPYALSALQSEEQWYACPQMVNGRNCTMQSNIYALGVLLFELLCSFESTEMHSATMSDLRHRILPPSFLSENSEETGFCLWLLHPEPSSRPTTREILQSQLMHEDNASISAADDDDKDDAESELLLDFLTSLKEEKQNHASKLVQDIQSLEEDIKEAKRRYSSRLSIPVSHAANEMRGQSHPKDMSSVSHSNSFSAPNLNEKMFMRNISQLEDAYFSMRSQISHANSVAAARSDKGLLKNQYRISQAQIEHKDIKSSEKTGDQLGDFFEGLCKFARYSKFEVCGSLRSGDLLNSANVICSLSFDRDEELIAAAGMSKRIKIFDFGAFMHDSVDVHYPVMEMCNKSKLSCVCWNSYIKNFLASTDYDGVVQMWDAGTGQGFAQYAEHQKRAWSVDFCLSDPTKFASGSDDCSAKLWSINEKRSIGTIWSPANVCSVQFSASHNQMLGFGSADYKVYCYDLRYARVPWCTLAGHEKAVSYVKFLDSETLVSASTDNTLKLWDLNKTSATGVSSDACTLTYRGHTNQKNFVGLSAFDGYITCGSETNEVFSYYRSLPMPIASYKFGCIDPVSGHEHDDSNRQFVSSVCWSRKSNILVAANSTGNMKLLKLA